MQISFFEEFPTKENIQKISLLTFPTKLYLAAKSTTEFLKLTNQIQKQFPKNKIQFIYWPLLEIPEGYWISPFSQRKALQIIFNQLNNQSIPTMLDLELPTTQNPFLYFTQFFNFFRNKKLIKNFIASFNEDVYLAEYYPQGKFKEKIMRFFGLHYQTVGVKIIKMLYCSMHSFKPEFLEKEIQWGKQKYQNNYLIAFGTIAVGIKGTETLLSPQQLQQDLTLAKKNKIAEVILFRLGGLNPEYLKIIQNFY